VSEFTIAVGSALAVALVALGTKHVRALWDRRRIHAWLVANTEDAPGASHVETLVIAKALGVPEDRTRLACLADTRIKLEPGKTDSWSVWRASPQSVYESRGVRQLGD